MNGEGFWEGLDPPQALPSTPLPHLLDTTPPVTHSEELCPPSRRSGNPHECMGKGGVLQASCISSGPPESDHASQQCFPWYLPCRRDSDKHLACLSEQGQPHRGVPASQRGSPGHRGSTHRLAVQGRDATCLLQGDLQAPLRNINLSRWQKGDPYAVRFRAPTAAAHITPHRHDNVRTSNAAADPFYSVLAARAWA